MIKYDYRYILGVVEGVSGSPVVLHHSPGALATTRLPLDTQQHLFLITMITIIIIITITMRNSCWWVSKGSRVVARAPGLWWSTAGELLTPSTTPNTLWFLCLHLYLYLCLYLCLCLCLYLYMYLNLYCDEALTGNHWNLLQLPIHIIAVYILACIVVLVFVLELYWYL